MLLQQVINVLLLGGIYACIGVGFSLVYGVMNIINLTHGSFIMMGAYATYLFFMFHRIDPFISFPFIMLIHFAFGYILQKYVINYVVKTQLFMTMILTYGCGLIILNIFLVLWKPDSRSVITAYSGTSFVIGDIVIPYVRLAIFAVAVLLTIVLYWFMKATKTGNAIKATALNKEAARLQGIDIGHIYAVTFGLASALAAAAGSLIAMVYSFSPNMELTYLTKAFIVAILGGLGNMVGSIVGGLVLALFEIFGLKLFGPSYQNLVSYSLFILVLVFRPYGIIGKRFYAEVKV